jgi:hypothetical protein
MRFGRQMTLERDGNVMTVTEEVFANFETVKRVSVQTEIVRIRHENDILPEFLKLLDRQKAGEIDLIGIQLLRDQKTGSLRVEESWTVPDLP